MGDTDCLCACESFFMCMRLNVKMHVSHWLCICILMLMCARVKCCVHVTLVCSGIAKNAKNACAKSLGTVHGVYNEGEPSVGLFV